MVRISGQPPVSPQRPDGPDRPGSAERSGRSAKAESAPKAVTTSAVAASTSPTSGARAELGPTHRALGASQDAVTFVQSADGALSEIESLLSATAADPSTAAANLARIDEITASATSDGRRILDDFRTVPISFGGGPSADGFSIEVDLRVSLDGSDGVLSVDVLGAGPDHVSAVTAAAAAQVARVRAELGGIEEELRTEALGLVHEVTGPTHDLETIRQTLDALVTTLKAAPGTALAAQGRVDTNATGHALAQ